MKRKSSIPKKQLKKVSIIMEALEENNISFYCDKSRIYSDDLRFVLNFPCEEILLRQKKNAEALIFNVEVDRAYMRKIIYLLVPIAQDKLKMDFTIFPPFGVIHDTERGFIHLNYGGYARDWKAFYQDKSIYEINPNLAKPEPKRSSMFYN